MLFVNFQRQSLALVGSLALAMLAGVAQADTVSLTVDSHAGPWDQASNPIFDYGVHDNNGPAIVGGLTSGESVTISYLSGLTDEFGLFPTTQGIGDGTEYPSDQPGSSGKNLPGFYTASPSSVFLGALIGTFADSNGVIVGTPFFIGNGPLSLFDPLGGTQLELGINDDKYFDNDGGLTVSIETSDVPEPAAWAVLILGFVFMGGALRRRNRVGGAVQA
jgi:hypothetical protein